GSNLKSEREAWRKRPRGEKQRDFGVTDLWDPATRAALCASCHVGNREEGKGVTHEMYSPGHPPLPGFAGGPFFDQIPRPWQYEREKDKKVRELLHFDPREREQTKLIVIAAAVNLAQEACLLAAQGGAALRAAEPDKRALDLANFECFACHHDLKTPSWRQ